MKYRYLSIHKLGKKYPHDYGNLQEMEISQKYHTTTPQNTTTLQ